VVRRVAERVRRARIGLGYTVSLPFRCAPVASAVLLVQTVATGLAAPLAVWAMAGLVDGLARAGQTGGDPLPVALPWLGALLLAFGARSLETAGASWLGYVIGLRVDAAVQRDLFRQAVAVPLAAFEQPEYYTRLETGRNARGRLIGGIFDLAQGGRAAVGIAGLLAVFVQAHWLIAAVLLGTTLFRAAIGARLSRAYNEVQFGASPERREHSYWAGLLAGRPAAAELRLFGLLEYLVGRWRGAFERYLALTTAARWRTARYGIASQAVEEGVNLATLLFLLALALRGAITAGSLVALLYGLTRLREFVQTLSWTTARQVEREGVFGHLRAFLDLPAEPRPARPRPVPRPLRQGVRFEGVGFTYPGRSQGPEGAEGAEDARRAALTGIDLLLRPGERVALVGENGAGKTTLARLLLGLYRPTVGRITVDGIDLRELDPEDWRRQCTAVFQDYVRYLTTVGENIAYGDVAGLDGDGPAPPRIAAAARLSGADAIAAGLPRGYATPLGKEFEGGVELSTGQWQRLALARAYIRDAQIVALDEPTAAQDPRAEVEVYRQFAAAMAGRCAVLVSHRLGSARLADRIVVLRAGRIVEEGHHQSLLNRGGEYAGMYRLQAAWYGDGGDTG
jgi:ATP-binding cassette subfamily B protein